MEVRDEDVSPYWIDHEPEMKKGSVDFLPTKEIQFWNKLINKYLLPLDKDAEVSAVISAVHFPTLNIPIF
jgi:chitin synthase